MKKKKFNSKFYCSEYRKLEHISKARKPNDLVFGQIRCYDSIDESAKDEMREKFSALFSVDTYNNTVVYFPVKHCKEIKKYIRDIGGYLDYDDYVYSRKSIPGGYLFSGWGTGYKTKILPEDLPDTYVKTLNYKKRGYIETAGVVDVLYSPSPFHNHSFKDDFLYISYSEDIDLSKDNYDEYIFGGDIVQVIEKIGINNPELEDKVKDIKAKMVEQYNLYADHENSLGLDFIHVNKVEDFSELL